MSTTTRQRRARRPAAAPSVLAKLRPGSGWYPPSPPLAATGPAHAQEPTDDNASLIGDVERAAAGPVEAPATTASAGGGSDGAPDPGGVDRRAHGTRTAYNEGCRCSDCTRANRLYVRQHRSGDPTPAPRLAAAGQARRPVPEGDGLARLAVLVDEYQAAAATRRGADGWKAQSACAGLVDGRFYPAQGGATKPAKAICRTCPVSEQCLVAALARGEKFGIWGGHSERERRRLRRALGIARRRPGAAA